MPSGTATSYADLLTSLQAACTAAGYSLNGNVLSKGTLFTEVKVQAYGLSVQGGTGQTAGALTGRSNYQLSYLGLNVFTGNPTTQGHPIVFPVNYDIYIGTAPDEVYLFINYEVNCYQYIGFGQSNMPGLGGTGNWYVGTASLNTSGNSWDFRTIGGGGATGNTFNCGMFDGLVGFGNANGAIDHSMESAGNWNVNYSCIDRWVTMNNSPSAWNGESILQPIQVYTTRTGGTISMTAQLGHARWVMLDNLVDGQILTFGPDKWKVYPLWRRSAPRTSGPTPVQGGTSILGHAIRYDGP